MAVAVVARVRRVLLLVVVVVVVVVPTAGPFQFAYRPPVLERKNVRFGLHNTKRTHSPSDRTLLGTSRVHFVGCSDRQGVFSSTHRTDM